MTVSSAAEIQRVWWVPVLRGVFLLVMGGFMLANPLWSVTALVWIFGIFAIIDGVVALAEWFTQRKESGAGWWLLSGLVSLVIGLVAVIFTNGTAKFIFWMIAIWVLLVGILQIIGSIVRFRAKDAAWMWLLASGLVSFLIGLLLITHPQTSVKVVVVVLGLFAFVAGVLLVVGGFAAKGQAKQSQAGRV
ncbi:HdeD family acid-resistance protein [Cellulomonas sp. McL0617]|uniref:HdeD family acid-resistance protein n=1 Tax=Cellulomonas sp. McL0617 TaxID=3415675 RepID=UPI003CF059D7